MKVLFSILLITFISNSSFAEKNQSLVEKYNLYGNEGKNRNRVTVDVTTQRGQRSQDFLDAANTGNMQLVEQIIKESQDSNNALRNLLVNSILYGYTRAVELILNSGKGTIDVNTVYEIYPDVKTSENNVFTALEVASRVGASKINCTSADSGDVPVKMVKLLLLLGADVHFKDYYEETALSLAAYCGGLEMVKTLIDHDKSQAGAKDRSGCTPFIQSVDGYTNRGTDLALVDFLLKTEGNIDISCRFGNYGGTENMTALMIASKSYYKDTLELVKYLLDHDANINLVNSIGQTALMIAIANENFDVAKLLIEKSETSGLNIQDKYERTALDYALKGGNASEFIEIQKQLIQSGALSGI